MDGESIIAAAGERSAEDRSLSFKLSVIARALRNSFDHRSRGTGLTRAQWRTIAIVRLAEGSTQHRLARLLDVGDVTASRMIDRLCDDGLIERRRDPEDRRAHRIYLTPAATPLLEQLQELATAEESRAFDGISAAEQAELHRLLDRILGNLRSPWDEPPTG
jgi:MarR family transcriptional regulator for hemolysin